MRRREFIAGLLGATEIAKARADQAAKVYRLAIFDPSTPVGEIGETSRFPAYRVLFAELRRLGYVEGGNLLVERFSGEGRSERSDDLAREVVDRHPDVIYASSSPAVRALKAVTRTIPIIGGTGDPVANGLVTNIARPGGNVTGASGDAGIEILSKRLELLREMTPRLSTVGFLASREAWEGPYGPAIRLAAEKVGTRLVGSPLEAPFTHSEYRRAILAIADAGANGLLVSDQPLHLAMAGTIVSLVAEARLPAMYAWREVVQAGGLIAYAFDLPDMMRHLAGEIDQVLRGANAGDIPYYQASKFELVINLQTAKVLGVVVPVALLARADEVIE